MTPTDHAACARLAVIARDFHARGWMWGTAGNLSVRCSEAPASFWISASGLDKGQLTSNDFLNIALHDGAVLARQNDAQRPSAESAIHAALYRLFPEAQCCLHGHSVDACLVATQVGPKAFAFALPALEMVKGLGICEQTPAVALPLFDNHLDVPRIAADITARFSAAPPRIPALLIRGHGITAWGKDIDAAYHHAECLEFLLAYTVRAAVKGL